MHGYVWIEFQTEELPTLWAIFNQAYPELSGPVQIDDKSEIQTNNLISDNVNTHEFLTGKLKEIIPVLSIGQSILVLDSLLEEKVTL